MTEADENFEVTIKATSGWQVINLPELWSYRDLILTLVRRDFLSKYSQTVLGPVWFVIQPVLTSIVFSVIFGRVAKIPTDGLPHILFYFSALLPWNYFSQVFNSVGSTFTANRQIFSKVYFPRLAIPFSSIISYLISFGIQLLCFLGFWVYFKYFTVAGGTFQFTAGLLMLPVLILYAAIIAVAGGLWMTALTSKYRDIQHITPFLIQLWMYGTPIIYPMSQAEGYVRQILLLNPMVTVTEGFRYALLGRISISVEEVLLSTALTFVALLTGLLVFHKVEKTVVDTL